MTDELTGSLVGASATRLVELVQGGRVSAVDVVRAHLG
jgi:hypothetical protein